MLKGNIISCISTVVLVASLWMAASPLRLAGQTDVTRAYIPVAGLRSEVRDFMAKEVTVHFGAINSFASPPDRVNGSITTGEYTWGSFMRVVAAQSDVGGSRMIAGKDTARPIAEM